MLVCIDVLKPQTANAYIVHMIVSNFYLQTIEALNSYTFGHVLYHLLFGQQLNSSSYEVLPEGCPSELGETQYLTWCGISDYKIN